MSTSVTEAEVLDFLHSVERGEVSLAPTHEPQEDYAGIVSYKASNGWEITVFNDANEWDYVEQLRTADGRECDYDDIYAHMPQVDAYRPAEEAAWSRYRIPGYLKFRCVRCGQLLRDRSEFQAPFFCHSCNEHPVI